MIIRVKKHGLEVECEGKYYNSKIADIRLNGESLAKKDRIYEIISSKRGMTAGLLAYPENSCLGAYEALIEIFGATEVSTDEEIVVPYEEGVIY